MLKKFIERPVLSTVISILVLTLGLVGLTRLPISQYPDIAPPTVVVQATYTGASSDVVLKSVIVPLEQQINGVENMDYITSSAGNDGSALITVSFKIGSDPNLAAINVQNAVSRASSVLPQEVTQAGVTVRKKQTSSLLTCSLVSENPAYDQTFLQNYAEINIIPVIKRIQGVGDATLASLMDYSMRIWLNPQTMASYGLVPADITAALADQNIQAAPGQFGERGGQAFQYVIKYPGTLVDTTQFGDIIIRSNLRGRILRLHDVARIELGALNYFNSTRTNGHTSVSIDVAQVAGSNAHLVIQQSLQAIDRLTKNFPKGIKFVVLQNTDDFLNASIGEVIRTLIEAFILVFVVVFVFLQDFRSTLIPAISVPVAIVGTFFFLNLFGFTINLLTLFAIILAIGIVVDDAIVVVEAVHARLDEGYTSSKQASIDALGEISGAIISITLVMSAVFIPVSFIGGSAGVFYKQFGLTLAIAIILSAINALTLSPALCALFLHPHADAEGRKKSLLQRFYLAFNTSFARMSDRYGKTIGFFSKRKWIPVGMLAVFVISMITIARSTPTGFVPNEDLGAIQCDISLPADASLDRTDLVTRKLEAIARTFPEINSILAVDGKGPLSGPGSNYGMVVMRLIPWDKRKRDINAIMDELKQKSAGIIEAKLRFFGPPTIQGFGSTNGFALQLQDNMGGDIVQFSKIANSFIAALSKRPEIQFAATAFDPNFPQYLMQVNVPKVKEAGLNVTDITGTMQGYFGGIYASNLNVFGQQYRVMVQASPEYRTMPETLHSVFVRTGAGDMVPITEFVTLTPDFGPQTITRFNLFTSIAVNGTPAQGYSSGQAVNAIAQVAAQTLPQGYGYEFSGITREEMANNNQTVYVFLLCLIFVYLLLSAQYESYILPLAVLLAVPVGIAGAFIFIHFAGISNNIYLQITLVMLIGLLAKNAILIVEFAVERRRAGMDLVEAAVRGAQARLRPILMTSFAFILGLLPLMLASGAGANGDNAIGTGAVGGMLIGTVFGIFITPILFIIFQGLQERIKRPVKLAPALVLLGCIGIAGTGCKSSRAYQSQKVDSSVVYRGAVQGDTTTIAAIKWNRIFSDTILQNLIEEGIDNNLDLQIAYSRIRQEQAYYRQATLALYPSVDGALTTKLIGNSNTARFPYQSAYTQYREELNIGWTADIWGRLNSARRAQLATLLQTQANARAVQTELVAGIANLYYTLIALDRQLDVTQKSVVAWQSTADVMRKLKKADIVTGAAIVQSEASKYAAQASVYDLLRSITQTENALDILLGKGAVPVPRSDVLTGMDTLNTGTGIPAQLLAYRPDVQAAEAGVRNTFELTRVARAAFYPSIDLSATGGYGSLQSFFSPGSLLGTLIASLTQPIFQNGANRTRLRVAQESRIQAILDFKKVVLSAGQEVSDALTSLKQANAKLAIRQLELDNLQKAVSYTQQLVRYGSANYIEVLTAQQALLSAQLDQVKDFLQQQQAAVDLYRSLGGGWQ